MFKMNNRPRPIWSHGRAAGRAFVTECLDSGVTEINPETLSQYRLRQFFHEWGGAGQYVGTPFLEGFYDSLREASTLTGYYRGGYRNLPSVVTLA